MKKDTREDLLASSMLEQETRNVCGYKLRPFSYGSLQIAYKLNLTLFTGGSESNISDADIQRQISTFVWMQASPQDKVIEAVLNGSADMEALRFSLGIEFKDIPHLLAEVNRISEQVSANDVRVESKDKDTGDSISPPGKY